jgi:hypothetical protein
MGDRDSHFSRPATPDRTRQNRLADHVVGWQSVAKTAENVVVELRGNRHFTL